MIVQEASLANSRNRTRILLAIAAIYALVQVGLYSATIAQVPCSQANSLLSTIMCTYLAQLLASALFILVLTKNSLRVLGTIFGAFTAVFKLASVIYLAAVGGSHLGDCYILKNTRNMMMAALCIEIGVMAIVTICVELIMRRIETLSTMNQSLQKSLDSDRPAAKRALI